MSLSTESTREFVWEYPRPPRLELSNKHISIVFNGVEIAKSDRAQRVLETSHPPVYYLPPSDIQMEYLQPTSQQSFCEWKGLANYYNLTVGERQVINAGWSYFEPTFEFSAIANYIAFYAGKMDACYVDGEKVIPQPGGFYGGWITKNLVGPFKSSAGVYLEI
jgi:uncharacterized protein (DUF427 family)